MNVDVLLTWQFLSLLVAVSRYLIPPTRPKLRAHVTIAGATSMACALVAFGLAGPSSNGTGHFVVAAMLGLTVVSHVRGEVARRQLAEAKGCTADGAAHLDGECGCEDRSGR